MEHPMSEFKEELAALLEKYNCELNVLASDEPEIDVYFNDEWCTQDFPVNITPESLRKAT